MDKIIEMTELKYGSGAAMLVYEALSKFERFSDAESESEICNRDDSSEQ